MLLRSYIDTRLIAGSVPFFDAGYTAFIGDQLNAYENNGRSLYDL